MRAVILLLVIVTAVGCNERKSVEAPAAKTASVPFKPALAVSKPMGNPADVLVDIDGTKLTRGEASVNVEKELARYEGMVPPERLESVRARLLDDSVEQFVAHTLILKEIDKQSIVITPEDEKAGYEEIKKSLPAGVTIEDIIKSSPMAEQQIRDQIRTMLKADKMLGDHIKVSDEELVAYTEKNKERLVLPENVHARHILIATTETDTEQTKAEKKKKAEGIRQELVKGADFAELAAKNSDCPSKQRGGDLGSFPREGKGAPVKPFADAAFSQEIKAIGPVVETQFGFHIIQVLEHSQGGPVPREQVASMLKNQKRQKALEDLVQELKAKAKIKYLEPKSPARALAEPPSPR